MIKSIMICTDGSNFSEAAADYALYLAEALDASLKGLHVLDARLMEGPLLADIAGWIGAQPYGGQMNQFKNMLKERGQSILQALADRGEKAGREIHTDMREGYPLRTIMDAEAGAELLVIGKAGEHAELNPNMPGSLTDRLIRHTERPCLITPAEYTPITRMLAAYDGSVRAGGALHEALELSQALSIGLVIVTASEGLREKTADEVLGEAEDLASAHDCDILTRSEDGSPREAIPRVMQDEDCDLLVMGSHGHRHIQDLIVGSTVNHMLAHLPHPVLVSR